ncbi:peptide ABC transporter ATP-binding protein [Paenibacillus sp. FSL R7-0273]|uniref:staphylopine uptake ABC transporter ATP-binding protein CntF n=1 Tax=Paenibacillus sp. FSL R7-0273 TaxID=1536772 RepID=UPI0004F5E455|nr:ABC transporter ATP-binding protein [Paenibacillus sp. FSL R7-0273]AIQ47372.1 peptide ABC transporter ATP-binding protein [Paenibacillus sp. FSL R7-0273]OMF96074.1 nickel import ATP-binding protein NikD [Paenibacillus sp. FSL R7-0273]
MHTLEVSNLRIWDEQTDKILVKDSSFQIEPESCLAIVGESGSGKSVTCRAIMRLNKANIRHTGSIKLAGLELSELSEAEMRKLRGRQLGLIMQNGMRAFDPSSVVGSHFKETLKQHYGWSQAEITARMARAMENVMLKDPVALMNKYPHQLSGGMLQRMMIALAIVLKPTLIIADEPTSALDTLSQYEVMEQLITLKAETGCSMIFVSHDLSAVKRIADDVAVMRNGEIIESGTAAEIFTNTQHAYTKYLIDAKQALNSHFIRSMGGLALVDR